VVVEAYLLEAHVQAANVEEAMEWGRLGKLMICQVLALGVCQIAGRDVCGGEDGAVLEFKVDQEPDRAPGGATARTPSSTSISGKCTCVRLPRGRINSRGSC
jgi:hypothetical protein